MSHLPSLLALSTLLIGTGACNTGEPDSRAADGGALLSPDASVGFDAALPEPDARPGGPDAGGIHDGGSPPGPDAAEPEKSLNLQDVYGVVNGDDDDLNERPDWFDAPFDQDTDLSAFVLPDLPGYQVHFVLSGDQGAVRIWNDEAHNILGDAFDSELIAETTLDADGATLLVEFGYYLVHGVLSARLLDSDGIEVDSQDVQLWSSPLILNHHLQKSEHVYVTDTPSTGSNNRAMIAGYRSVLSDSEFTAVPGYRVGFDIWMQDEIEFATSLGAQGQRLNTVIDSIRDRGLDVFAEDQFDGPGYYVGVWGEGAANSYDSFGNLEVTPPVTVDGVHYPYGRAYYGEIGNEGPNGDVGAFLQTQKVQAPFTLNTSWLCVGHIDEVSSWIPDPSSALGHKLLIADVPAALALIDSLDSGHGLTRYQAHGFNVAGDMQDDTAFRNENLDIQDDYLTPMLDTFKEATGITEDDIIRVPALFEDVGCGMAALIPGTVNLIVANTSDEQTHLFIPDPQFLNRAQQTTDPFITAFNALWPEALTPHYLDDWYSYHELLGEVHCGTNVQRTPVGNWWQNAMHLVEDN